MADIEEQKSQHGSRPRLRPVTEVALAAGAVLFLVGAGYRMGGLVRATGTGHPQAHGARALSTRLVQRAGSLRGNLRRMIALVPGGPDEQLGLDGEAFPDTLTDYWINLNTVASHFYNPTPMHLFTPAGREIMTDPQKLRTHLTYAAIQGVMSSLNDQYTRFLDPASYKEMQQDNSGSFAGIGAQLIDKNGKIVIVKPLPDTPAANAHVMPMDEIDAINGRSTDKMTSETAVKLIRGKPGTPVELTLKRAGKLLTVRLIRAVITSQHFESKVIDGDLGYMHLLMFDEQAADNIERALQNFGRKGTKGVILDLRDNPGGLLNAAIDVASKFIPPGPVVYVQERAGQRTALLTNNDARGQHRLPLVVLVNHFSASASEIVSGAIKDTHSGTLVGLTTWGKGLVQEVIPLNDNSAIALTIERYYTPSGSDINKKGVNPDVVSGHAMPEIDADTQAEITKWMKERDAVEKSQLDTAIATLRKQTGGHSPSTVVKAAPA